MKIAAEFVTSAATASGFPCEGLAEIVLIGRSNVGKSSLINALVRRPLARTSGAPGKTRLANVYRVARGICAPVYLVDLPGYGFSRGGPSEFDELARAVFERGPVALFLVDARHPGLDNDRAAWDWLRAMVPARAAIATKIDKLSRAERARALMELDSVFECPVLPVSAVTGEGLDELWKLIDTLANNNSNNNRSRRRHNPGCSRSNNPPGATAPRRRKRSSASSSRR